MGSRSSPTFHEVVAGFPSVPAGSWEPSALLPPGSVTRRLTSHRVLVLGGGRALLMQLAHPLVAAGVADHGDRARLPWDRLWGTLDAVLSVVFGGPEQVSAVSERIASIHRGVTGVRGRDPYAALDHELLLWVHATLVDSATVTWERFVGPLPISVRARHYEEMKAFAGVFGLSPGELPHDLDDFSRYLATTIAGLRISAEARGLAREVLEPPASAVVRPAVALHRFVTVGLLPPTIRDGFGLRWSAGRERTLGAVAASVRIGLPVLPRSIRIWPHAIGPG